MITVLRSDTEPVGPVRGAETETDVNKVSERRNMQSDAVIVKHQINPDVTTPPGRGRRNVLAPLVLR